jgi:hypothetical protein
MSNSRSARRKLNLPMRILLGRFHAEVEASGPGGHQGVVQHDADCPGLRYQSMLRCKCKPAIAITKLGS